jgi:hypothetical protein
VPACQILVECIILNPPGDIIFCFHRLILSRLFESVNSVKDTSVKDTFSNDERSGFFCESFENPLKIAEAAAGDGLGGWIEFKDFERNVGFIPIELFILGGKFFSRQFWGMFWKTDGASRNPPR